MKFILSFLFLINLTVVNSRELPRYKYTQYSPYELLGANVSRHGLKIESHCGDNQTQELKGKSEIALDHLLSESEVGEISGYLFDGIPTNRFIGVVENDFYELPKLETADNVLPISLTYFYKVDLSKKIVRLISSDCDQVNKINQLEFGNRFVLKVKIHSSNLSDLKAIEENIELRKRNVNLLNISKILREFPLESPEDLTLQLNWKIQTEDYQKLIQWNYFLFDNVGVSYCFVERKTERGCDKKFQQIYNFLFKYQNNFMDSMINYSNSPAIVPYKILVNEKFKYAPVDGLIDFYKEKMYLNKIEEIFSLKLYFIENDGQPLFNQLEILDHARNNINLFEYYSKKCQFTNSRNEHDTSVECRESFQNYQNESYDINMDLDKIKLIKGFYFYCLQSNENSEAFVTVKAIQKFFGTTSCEDIKSMASSIKYLDLSSMQISDLSPLIDFINLEKINLKQNLISEYSLLEKFQYLVDIDLSYNQIRGLYVLRSNSEIERFRIFSNLFNSTDDEIENFRKHFRLSSNSEFSITEEQVCKWYNLSRFGEKNPQYMIFLNKNSLVELNGVVSPCSLVVSQL